MAGALVLLTAGAGPAAAQGDAWSERIIISVNGGAQATSTDLSHSGTFEEFLETGTFDAAYDVKSPTQVDGGVVLRLWGRMGIGVAGSYYDDRAGAGLRASIPHPLFFNRFRDVSGADSVTRRESAAHVHLTYLYPLGDRLAVIFSLGPSFFNVEQDVVDDIAYDQAFPFDQATFRDGVTRRVKESTVGYNVGADVTWRLWRQLGLGVLLRFSRATADLRASDRNQVSTNVGGLHTGAGIRLAF